MRQYLAAAFPTHTLFEAVPLRSKGRGVHQKIGQQVSVPAGTQLASHQAHQALLNLDTAFRVFVYIVDPEKA